METKFNMTPPNEFMNDVGWNYLSSVKIRYMTKQQELDHVDEESVEHFTYCGFDSMKMPEQRTAPHYKRFEPDKLQEILQSDISIAALLQHMMATHWPFDLRKKLRSAIRMKFENDYMAWYITAQEQLALSQHRLIVEYREKYPQMPEPEEFVPWVLTSQERMNIMRTFDSQLQLIAEWCMNGYSYRRSEWVKRTEILDITDIEPVKIFKIDRRMTDEEKRELLAEKRAEQRKEKDATEAAALAAMTPEARRLLIAKEKTMKLLASMKKQGLIPDDVSNLLDYRRRENET